MYYIFRLFLDLFSGLLLLFRQDSFLLRFLDTVSFLGHDPVPCCTYLGDTRLVSHRRAWLEFIGRYVGEHTYLRRQFLYAGK